MHESIVCIECHLSGTLLSLCVTCSGMHAHIPFQRLAIALANGFSSGSVLEV